MERAEDVRVLLAMESGSRAWGFASPDSDFDVRFVYVRPVDHYLRLEPARDVLVWRVDEVLDVDGWDVDKALRLLRGSNPSLFEWLASPIVYAEDPAFAVVRGLAAECFSLVASAHHYLSMGRNHLAALTGETVRLKKCLYAMRAILAARWVVAERAPAPMLLRDLVDAELEELRIGLALVIFLASFMMFTGMLVTLGAMMPTAKEASQWFGLVIMLIFGPFYGITAFVSFPGSPFVKFLSLFPFTAPIPLLLRNAVDNSLIIRALNTVKLCFPSTTQIGRASCRERV